MHLALQQAEKMLGNTKTNPAVGCVIVKDKKVISLSSTSHNGRPHAEINAIKFSKTKNNNSEIYTTLEPCSHYGKTPPCVNTIIRNKVKKVFFSVNDPDKRSYNKSSIKFKNEKICVSKGVLNTKINYFYRSYLKSKKNKLPFVTAKIAVSKDFYTKNKKKEWITNRFSRGRVHIMRSKHDSLLTSAKTIIKDNPNLTCRINGLEYTSPTRLILDKKLQVSMNSNVVKTARKYKTIIFFSKINKKRIKQLKNLGVKLIRFPINKSGNFNLKNILFKIKLLGFSRIFLESGLNLTSNFLRNFLVDDFQLFISNKNLGKNGVNNFKDSMKFLLKKYKPKSEKVNLFGDKLFSYRIK